MKFRVVIDTNVIVSHLLFPGGNPSKILDLVAADKLILLLSDEILDEAGTVLMVKFGFDSRRAGESRDSLLALAEMVKPRHAVDVIREDESDNRILECAWSGKAHFLITGDKKHLLPLKQFKGIQILSPAEFVRDFVP
jgi:putative PIN family toxin of toxin-antitoxin system